MKIKNLRQKIILIFFATALIVSLFLTFVPLPVICSPSESCYTVQNSIYAKTFNIKNDYFGDAIFFLMSFLIVSYLVKPSKSKDFAIRMGTFFGAIAALYFIYLQIFVIHGFCKYCAIIDGSMIMAFIISVIPFSKKHKRNKIRIKFE